MKKSWFLGALALLTLQLVSNQALAQCGVTMSCGGGNDPAPGVCQIYACFKDSEAKRRYEEEHNCKFPSGAVCNGKEIDEETQCCGKNAETGNDEVQEKQIKSLKEDFDWETYQKQCPNMRQSEGKPDDLWAQCTVGEKHGSDDHWPIKEVISNPENPKARPYCIDGCSTPPYAIDAAYKLNIFLTKDKDNPTGHKDSSFYDACRSHDICYQTCSSNESQISCDTRLRDQSLKECNKIPADHMTTIVTFNISHKVKTREKCINSANRMFNILSDFGFGETAFKRRKQQMCQCC